MSESLIPATAGTELLTRERCHILELLNDARVPAVSLARCHVEPGITTEWHSLAVDEYYVISAGTGLMQVGEAAAFQVGPGDAVRIPAGVAQRIANTGDVDLVFQCLCLPRFTEDCYTPLE